MGGDAEAILALIIEGIAVNVKVWYLVSATVCEPKQGVGGMPETFVYVTLQWDSCQKDMSIGRALIEFN
jgi:hypothetical protein